MGTLCPLFYNTNNYNIVDPIDLYFSTLYIEEYMHTHLNQYTMQKATYHTLSVTQNELSPQY